MTGTQSLKAFNEAKRFCQPKLANDYEKLMKPDSQGNIGSISNSNITCNPTDEFLFYVDEEPREGISLNFTPDGKQRNNYKYLCLWFVI